MATPTGSTIDDEVTYLSGITKAGTVAAISGQTWDGNGPDSTTPNAVATYNQTTSTVSKWGPDLTPGTSGGTQLYYFDPASNWTASERALLAGGLALWSAETNIQFAVTTNRSAATLDFIRGNANGDFAGGDAPPGEPIGATVLGGNQGPNVFLNVTTNDPNNGFGPLGFGAASYSITAIVHELGHYLGFYHGGPYNGTVNSATQQYSPYDSRLYSIMSYIQPDDTTAKFFGAYPVTGSSWNNNASTTPQMLDILAAQRLYGAPTTTPLSGGQVFGFNTNITGLIRPFFDFTVNTDPIVTLFDIGTGNTLDLSGYTTAASVNLNPGTFSSFDGLVNNLGIAFNTAIDAYVGGSGGSTVVVNGDADTITTAGTGNSVKFSGAFGSYLVSAITATRVTVTNLASSIVDTLNGVQALVFSDRTVQTSTLPVIDARIDDFNADGTSDILWQQSGGAVYDWGMVGLKHIANTTLAAPGTLPTSQWAVIGTGDFNGDKSGDLLWQNQQSGAVYEWNLTNGARSGNVSLGTLLPTQYQLIGTGDFNGDGTADLLWQDQQSGAVYDWGMVNGQHVSDSALAGPGALPLSQWAMIGKGDFNGDKTTDLLWQNKQTGAVYEWGITGGKHTSDISLGTVSLAQYALIGAGDFNGDGTTDLLWQDKTSGAVYEWGMMNGQHVTNIALGTVATSQWSLLTTGNFNGSSTADILWQNKQSGALYVWDMNGGQHVSTGDVYLGSLSTTDWHTVSSLRT